MNKIYRYLNEMWEYSYQLIYSLLSSIPSFSEVNPLIVVLSCQNNRHLWEELLSRDSNIIIFCGDNTIDGEYFLDGRILYLNCKDTYDFLPEKVYRMISAILDLPEYNNITHIMKIDDHDTYFNNQTIDKIKQTVNNNIDYCGQTVQQYRKPHNTYRGNNMWHFYKCPKDSIWYNIPYYGEYTPWVDGGCGYILSRKSMIVIKNYFKDDISQIYKNHIYEDLMIGLILRKSKIYPIKVTKLISGDK